MTRTFARAISAAGFGLLLASRLPAQELPLDSVLAQPVSAAAKYAQTAAEAAASVTIVTADDIRRYGYRTLADVLRGVPGFYTTYDRNYLYLGVRGFSRPGDYGNRVLQLLDGHTVNEGVFGSAAFGTDLPLDPDIIERVEIVHGPSSTLYGTGAMLASVNIVTRNGSGLDGLHASLTAGSAGLRQVSGSAGTALGSGVDLAVAGQWTEDDGADLHFAEYDSVGGGIAHGLDWDRHRSVRASMTWRGFSASLFASRRLKGIPTGAYGIRFNDPKAWTRDDRAFLELGQVLRLAPGAVLHLRGYADRYDYAGEFPYDQSYFDDARDQAAGGEARLQWDTGPANRVLVGFEYQRHGEARYAYWTADTTFYNRNVPYRVESAYIQDEVQISQALGLVVGLRRDAYGWYPATTTPRVALMYHPSRRTTFKLLYGEAFRAPNLYEVYYEDQQSGFKRSPGLRPERIRTLEGTWERRLSGFANASVSLYHYRLRDLIDTRLDPADSLLQFRNVAEVLAHGVTAGVRLLTSGGMSGYLNYAYQRAEDPAVSGDLTNSPVHLLKAGVGSDASRRVSVAAEARIESSRLTVRHTRTAGYLWTGAHLLVRLGRGGVRGGAWDRGELSLAVSNLLGTRYADPGGFEHLQAAIEQDGRTVSARLRLAW